MAKERFIQQMHKVRSLKGLKVDARGVLVGQQPNEELPNGVYYVDEERTDGKRRTASFVVSNGVARVLFDSLLVDVLDAERKAYEEQMSEQVKKIEKERKEYQERLDKQVSELEKLTKEMKRIQGLPRLEACTDFFRCDGEGATFRTVVVSEKEGDPLEWGLDERVPLPDWLTAKRVGNVLEVTVKAYSL